MCATFSQTYEGNQISEVLQLSSVTCIPNWRKKTCKKTENLEENWKRKKGVENKWAGEEKREKGGKISFRKIGRKPLSKLFKLASFCCRHEWSPREIENDFFQFEIFCRIQS